MWQFYLLCLTRPLKICGTTSAVFLNSQALVKNQIGLVQARQPVTQRKGFQKQPRESISLNSKQSIT